jgi:hypothetical protein
MAFFEKKSGSFEQKKQLGQLDQLGQLMPDEEMDNVAGAAAVPVTIVSVNGKEKSEFVYFVRAKEPVTGEGFCYEHQLKLM